jgi:hypothetical protein
LTNVIASEGSARPASPRATRRRRARWPTARDDEKNDSRSFRRARLTECPLCDPRLPLRRRASEGHSQLIGHAKVDTTLNVYTQVVDGSLRRAADTVGSELFTIVHKPEETMLGHPPKAAARAERGQEI